jgi:hypothetical protein
MYKERVFWTTLLACASFASGCELTGGAPPRYQIDPLVLSKKPVTGKVTDASPVLVACAEPVPPPVPEVALASATRTDTFSAKISESEPEKVGKSAEYLPPPTETPKTEPKAARLSEAPPRGESAPPGKTPVYGRADDFSWLQGVLEWDASGTLALRYNAMPSKDPVYGRVTLLFDSPLKELTEGDVIRVWGKFVSEEAAISPHGPPRYRVDQILMVRAHSS